MTEKLTVCFIHDLTEEELRSGKCPFCVDEEMEPEEEEEMEPEMFDCEVCGEVEFIEEYQRVEEFEFISNKVEFNGNTYCSSCFDEFEPQQRALAKHLNCGPEEIDETRYGSWEYGKREYLVLTDDEADEKWDEELDRYIEDCLDIPENLRFYFDDEKWKSDAKMDGRGHALSGYDGNENEVTDELSGDVYYIYRTN